MMNDTTGHKIIEEIAASIDIPETAYDKAEARYKDLSEWFGRKDSSCHLFSPHIYPQGSFRLGTVISPIDADGEYDLDMGCRLRVGLTKANVTQQQLKNLIGFDLEEYRAIRNIQKNLEEKPRCWRLKYADKLKFHLDTVPSIPETTERRRIINEALIRTGTSTELALRVANLTGAITDYHNWNYNIINDDWLLSNSEGFALWFESRMRQAIALMENLKLQAKAAKIDELPAYRWKSPLQKCVQLLKRHRDMFFSNDQDGKPASIIITTLAAMAYQGETQLADALENILSKMGTFVRTTSPRVPNPVNPAEDFTDKWNNKKFRHQNLEKKFWYWLHHAQIYFDVVGKERKLELITEMVKKELGVSLNVKDFGAKVGIGSIRGLLKPAAVPAGLSFPDKPIVPKSPAKFAW